MTVIFSRRPLLAAALALGCLVAVVTPARATYEPVSSGGTRLLLDRSFLAALRSEGISLSVRSPATLKGSTVSFPVIGGKFDPTTGRGEVEHDGALIFKAGSKNVPLKDLQLKTSRKRTPLAAKVGGSKLKLAIVKRVAVDRSGFGERISTSELTLSAKLATRLAKKLNARGLFKAGMPLGRTASQVSPETIALTQRNKAELSLTPGFQAKLDSLFVAVNPVFPAEHPGPFTLPIFGGTMSPDSSQGRIESLGTLEFLQLGGGQVLLHEPWLDLGSDTWTSEAEVLPSPPYAGKQARASVAGFVPTFASASAEARTVSVAGGLLLDAATAALFNEVFARPQGKDAIFSAGEEIGHLRLTGSGQ